MAIPTDVRVPGKPRCPPHRAKSTLMTSHRCIRPAGAACLLLSVALGACRDEVVRPDQGALPEEIATLPAGIHPIVSIPGLATATVGGTVLVRVHLHAVEVEDEIASYQGIFRYDPDVIEIQSGSFPEGVLGAWNQLESGTLRFAGAVVEGIGTRPIIELRGRLKRIPGQGDFLVELEEIVAADKLQVMTKEVVAAGQAPILTGANLDLQPR